jgi:hypothetical protein
MTLKQKIDSINTELDSNPPHERWLELHAERGELALRKYRSRKQIEAHPGVDEVMITRGFYPGDGQVIVYIAEGWRADDRTSTIFGEKLADVALGVACIERGEVE